MADPAPNHPPSPDFFEPNRSQVAVLEDQLAAARTDLRSVIGQLDISNAALMLINQQAMAAHNTFTTLNEQLQTALERERTTSTDLRNVLYSTDVATILLDTELHIRFFTPATRVLFNILPDDIGRPLADLNSHAVDLALFDDVKSVFGGEALREVELQMSDDIWFHRRILPYRNTDGAVSGVVITFGDITDRKQAAKALELAKSDADAANHAKSRFLAAASHDLRQPLQTLALLQSVLAKTVESAAAKALVVRLNESLSCISGMLNTLLDINQSELGSVHAAMTNFPINVLLARLHNQFSFHAEVQSLGLRVVPSTAMVHSDPRLLEHMIRNLLSNALKYTHKGKVLLGCRHHGAFLTVEVWDTGAGIPQWEHEAIFEEHTQLGNAPSERSRGDGLGLSIVRRLAEFLDLKVRMQSELGKGSGFIIEIPLAQVPTLDGVMVPPPSRTTRSAKVLLIEDNPSVRELLVLLLASEGHIVTAVANGQDAIEAVTQGKIAPDLIVTDHNLPNRMDGATLTTKLRELLAWPVPAIVLTGDSSKETQRKIAAQSCVQLQKPTKPAELVATIERLLPPPGDHHHALQVAAGSELAVIHVIDDDTALREALQLVLETQGYAVRSYASAEALLSAGRLEAGCLLIDEGLPGMSGLELLTTLRAQKFPLPSIMITGSSNVPMAVSAMKAGAADFIDKPVSADELLAAVARALERAADSTKLIAWQDTATRHVASLTGRQREIMDLVLAGHPSKNIAADLNISQRTVENHRAAIMRKTASKSLPALARLALAAQG